MSLIGIRHGVPLLTASAAAVRLARGRGGSPRVRAGDAITAWAKDPAGGCL
jgi:hypothetical protein